MPAFTSTEPELQRNGPLVTVVLGVVSDAEAALRDRGEPVPQPLQATMLLDTGASRTVIAAGLAQRLGLRPVGVHRVSTPSTTTPLPMPVYRAKLTLSSGPAFETTVIEAPLGGQAIQGLIGRDVLAQAVLIYIGYANQFTLAV